jgi:hypothetical protein
LFESHEVQQTRRIWLYQGSPDDGGWLSLCFLTHQRLGRRFPTQARGAAVTLHGRTTRINDESHRARAQGRCVDTSNSARAQEAQISLSSRFHRSVRYTATSMWAQCPPPVAIRCVLTKINRRHASTARKSPINPLKGSLYA